MTIETLLLPGYSLKNKDWAEETKKELPELPITVIYWPHWTSETKEPDWVEKELQKLKDKVGSSQVNWLVKSIGSYVAMRFLQENPTSFNKIIICGLPLYDLSDEDKQVYSFLAKIPKERIIIIQNENDNHGSYAKVEAFVHTINPEIKIISKPRDDHEYPYFEDFRQFLKN